MFAVGLHMGVNTLVQMRLRVWVWQVCHAQTVTYRTYSLFCFSGITLVIPKLTRDKSSDRKP